MKIPFVTWVFFIPFLTVLVCIDLALVSGQCRRDQEQFLLQLNSSLLYNQTKSTKLVSWNLSVDCCRWGGVTCDPGGLGRVIDLNLSSESISEGLEDSIGLFSLQFLQRLDLSFNNFNTTMSARFATLTDLVHLNLSNAGFVGQIPVQIARLTRLVSLDLSVSTLYYAGVHSLKLESPNLAILVQNLTWLKELHLDGVNISADGHEWSHALSSLTNLQVLGLSNCLLSGSIDPSLANLSSLRIIHLEGNNLTAPIPEFFANFSNLTALHLSNCELHGTFPENIFQVQTLEILDLSNNKLLKGSLPEFRQNFSLHTLVLGHTNFSGKLPESIGKLGNLSRIELENCNFSGPIPSSMGNLTQLVYLDFSTNAFTGPIPSLRMCKNLTYIDLSYNELRGETPSTYWEGLLNLVNVDLSYNSLNGSIPPSLFAIPLLKKIQLSFNHFGGQVPEFANPSSSSLDTLDLSSNKLEGSIPHSVFDLRRLNVLLLSSNKLNGTIQLDWIQKLVNLTYLDLSYNMLNVEASASNSTLLSFTQISSLKLASCNLRVFPDLRNQSKLNYLDLSDNHIMGTVPHWIHDVGNGSLVHLNLSHNHLVGLQVPLSLPRLSILDLHGNQLQGNIPTPPQSALYVDYSSNNFTCSIPPDIGTNLSVAFFFSLSNNSLTGVVPPSICKASYLQVLDLSSNNLNGTIPACLIEMSQTLAVLNLRRNRFSGSIHDEFASTCKLKTLDLSGNLLKGTVPKSLTSCSLLEVLDLGNNGINDNFPCLLKNIYSVRVLVLRNNKFNGPIGCPCQNGTWPRLQIVDLAFNDFIGHLPERCLSTWEAMKGDGSETDHLKVKFLAFTPFSYYQDSITVTSKGLEMELVKILTVFTSIDFSGNNFEGPIPEALGQFSALSVLNLSHNALTGSIPSSLGKLSQLESLDLSFNHLTGTIPQQLAGLTFLSVLNLSYNKLVGSIPTSTQLQSFPAGSFEGNLGLCGPPFSKSCTNTSVLMPEERQYQRKQFDWQFVVPGLGFGLGAGAVVAPVMFWKKANKWFDDRIDKVLMLLLPILGLRYYRRHDWRIEQEEDFEENITDADDEEEREIEYDFGGSYCVFCTKLDITRKRVIHDPNCTCHHSPPMSSTSSSSSYSS